MEKSIAISIAILFLSSIAIAIAIHFASIANNPASISGQMVLTCSLSNRFGPDLSSLFKLREIWSFDSQENNEQVATSYHILRPKCT